MEKLRENRRLVLLVIVVLVMLCLLGVLAVNIFLPGGGDDVVKEPPTPTPVAEPTDDGPDVVITPDILTPTPTRVLAEEPTAEPSPEPEEDAEHEESDEDALPEPTPTSTADDFTSPPKGGAVIIQIEELIENGDFSAGFDEETGVGLEWNNFKTNEAVITFSPESAEPFIHSDGAAQRISVEGAFQTNQHAGLYQTVEVVSGETYTVTIHGQIRSGHGDVNQSGYGYRVQYAVDQQGGENWQTLTDTAWIEMPWGEELLNSSEVNFSEFTEQITAESDELTLFVRTWNKWAEPGLVEYTLDSISLVGPEPGSIIIVEAEPEIAPGDELIDQPLPVTGDGDGAAFITDGRFWGAMLVLLILAVGATYRAKWRY